MRDHIALRAGGKGPLLHSYKAVHTPASMPHAPSRTICIRGVRPEEWSRHHASVEKGIPLACLPESASHSITSTRFVHAPEVRRRWPLGGLWLAEHEDQAVASVRLLSLPGRALLRHAVTFDASHAHVLDELLRSALASTIAAGLRRIELPCTSVRNRVIGLFPAGTLHTSSASESALIVRPEQECVARDPQLIRDARRRGVPGFERPPIHIYQPCFTYSVARSPHALEQCACYFTLATIYQGESEPLDSYTFNS